MHDDLIKPANEIIEVSQALLSQSALTDRQQEIVHLIITSAKFFCTHVREAADIITSMKAIQLKTLSIINATWP